jgi:ketosteroid isomerase-like protein
MAAPHDPDDAAEADSDDEAAVRAANRAFYDAFEARDLDAMSDCWEHSDRVVCTHPGWRTLRGWGAVSGSWFALFGGPSPLQFILTAEQVAVAGDAAWVNVDENLISPEMGGGTVAAINVFVRDGARWRLVAHHGSPVAPQAGPSPQ